MNRTSYRKPAFSLDRTRNRDLTEQLVSSLRMAILTGYYRAGDFLPPVRDLAAEMGVSPGIAARALTRIRDEGLISPRPRIGSVVCEKNRPLWKGHIVIVVTDGPGNPLENCVYTVLRDRLTAAGYLPTSVTVAGNTSKKLGDTSLLETVLRQQTDLVVQLEIHDNISLWLSRVGVPFVRVSPIDLVPPNCVGLVRRDYSIALGPFVAQCAERKVRNVLQLAARHNLDVTQPLASEGIAVETVHLPARLNNASGPELSAWAADTLSKLLDSHAALPDLLFPHDDHMTTGAIAVLLAAGVRIPEDVRIVTWANKDYGPFFIKPFTRMEMDNAANGALVADSVLEFLRTGSFPKDVVIGPKYIRGETF